MDVLASIRAAYPNMTKTEKKLADFILEENDAHYFLHVTLQQLSSDAGVGQATVIRMINTCGYSAYRPFMAELSQVLYQKSAKQLNERRSTETLVDDWSEMLQLCQSSLDKELLHLAAVTICHASIIICSGYGNSAHIASLAGSHFRRAGLLATTEFPGEIIFSSENFNDKTRAVFLAFSVTGETAEIVRMAKEYADGGVCVIAITGRTESTLAKIANFTFFSPSQVAMRRHGRWLDGMVSQLFIIEKLSEEVKKIKYIQHTED